MITPDIWVQVPGWIAAALVVASFQAATLPRLIGLQMAGYCFLGVQFVLLDAWTGAVMTGVGIVRLMLALAAAHRPELRRIYPVFLPIIWATCAATWVGWGSLLPAIGYTLGTLAVIQERMRRTRWLFLAAHPFWLAYNVIVGSSGGVAMELCNIASSTTAILRHRRADNLQRAPS